MQSLGRYLALEGNIRVLAVQTLVSQIGFGMFYVIWQPYLLSTGITVRQLGFIQTMINISTSLGLLFWGNISDRIGRKPAILGASVCRTIAIAVLVLSGHYVALIVFGFFIGFTALFMCGNPARNALIAESVEGSKMGTALSTLITISQGTSTLVASAGGFIALKMGYMPIFYVTVIGEVIGLLIIWRYVKETHTPREVSSSLSLLEQVKGVLVPERNQLSLYMVMLIQGFSYAVAYSLFYGTLTDTYGVSPLELGFLSTSFNLIWALDSIPLGKLVDRIGKLNGMIISIVMAFITVSGFLLFKEVKYFILFNGISALDIGLWVPAYTSYVGQSVSKENRSRIMGKLDAYGRIGSIPAPWVGGLLYERYGFNAPLMVQAVLLVVIVVILINLKSRQSKVSGLNSQ